MARLLFSSSSWTGDGEIMTTCADKVDKGKGKGKDTKTGAGDDEDKGEGKGSWHGSVWISGTGDYEDMKACTNDALREKLRDLGLSTRGNKIDLITRIEQNHAIEAQFKTVVDAHLREAELESRVGQLEAKVEELASTIAFMKYKLQEIGRLC